MPDSNVGDTQIVNALSRIELPSDNLRHIDLRGVVSGLEATAINVQKTTADLGQARQDVKDGWWIGNWWYDRKEKVEDLQYSLQSFVGDLTVRTTQLLIFNTAISRELNRQQERLLDQQEQLKQQTQKIEQQNGEILRQQKLLEEQQKEIKAANQGLLEAKGITHEQAVKLVDCVKRVEGAEAKMEAANHRMMGEITETATKIADDLRSDLSELHEQLSKKFSGLDVQFAGSVDSMRHLHKSHADEIAQNLERISAELGQKMSDTERNVEEYAASTQKLLDSVRTETISFIERSHASLDAKFAASFGEQNDQRDRVEKALNTHISELRQENGRRFKIHLKILGIVACIAFATAAEQIVKYIHH